jgi:hypothetical protein
MYPTPYSEEQPFQEIKIHKQQQTYKEFPLPNDPQEIIKPSLEKQRPGRPVVPPAGESLIDKKGRIIFSEPFPTNDLILPLLPRLPPVAVK